MPHYRLTGNYGTFAVSRVVIATNEDGAWMQTGIMGSLIDAGWHVDSYPDGEEWEITPC